jgi:hypothetical protein
MLVALALFMSLIWFVDPLDDELSSILEEL